MNLGELLSIAAEALRDLSRLGNPDFRLEQAEYKKDEDVWEVVVSYLVENTNKRNVSLMAITSEFQYLRLYKKLRINKNKEVVALYMYDAKE